MTPVRLELSDMTMLLFSIIPRKISAAMSSRGLPNAAPPILLYACTSKLMAVLYQLFHR